MIAVNDVNAHARTRNTLAHAHVHHAGQTGSGKTHTMRGNMQNEVQHGVIQRSIEALFRRLKEKDYTDINLKGAAHLVHPLPCLSTMCKNSPETRLDHQFMKLTSRCVLHVGAISPSRYTHTCTQRTHAPANMH